MASLRGRLDPRLSPGPLIAVSAVLAAGMAGVLMAARVPLGVAVVVAAVYAPLVAVNLPAGLAVWIGVLFIRNLSFVSIGPNAAGIMIAFAWIATLRTNRATVRFVLDRHRRLVLTLLALLAWVSVSLVWARDPGMGAGNVWQWYVLALLVMIVATALVTPGHIRLVTGAFVIGAVLSVLIGFAGGGLVDSSSAIERATETDGRLQGGGGDPNYLAGGLIPAIAFAGALLGNVRNPLGRWALLAGAGILALGLAATQSRAGLIAAAVALVLALFIYRQRRLYLVAVVAAMVSLAGVWFATNPDAWERTTSFDDGGAGRSELWQVAWKMSGDHPVVGVGLNNFRTRSSEYVREPGSLSDVALIAERPRVVHNLYLELLAETGVIGLAIYLGAVLACLLAAAQAARRFDDLGNAGMASIARAALIGAIAMLCAGFFISYATDARLWFLLGLGPALLALARREGQQRTLGSPA